MALLDCMGVSFSYNGSPALRGVTFELSEGQMTGVVGPNGSGKSTMIKVLDRILKPREGEVLLKGKPLGDYTRKGLAMEIGLVPQSYKLEFDFSVREVVEMGRYARGKSGHLRGVGEILDRMDLSALADRSFTTLSGGEQQRVVLAQALAQETGLMLLDEPASHLDVSHQLNFFDMLKELNAEGLTILCVLHDLNLALQYFDDLIMLSRGELTARGAATDVLSPDNLGATFGVRAHLHRHAGRSFLTFSARARGTRKERVHLVCGGGSGSHLMRELTDRGFLVTAGVVNALDSDEVTGRELGLEMAVEAPFSEITDESFEQNLQLARKSDLVVLADTPIGRGNLRNLEAVGEAYRAGIEVWALERTEKDFTGKVEEFMRGLGGVTTFGGVEELIDGLVEKWGR